MAHLLVVLGATGNQGSSVVNAVITDPELSKQYKVRTVTRDTSKPAAMAMKEEGVEVVQGDFDHEETIHASLQDAHTVFLMTNTTIGHPQGRTLEVRQGKAVADAAVSAGAQYIIYSTQYSAAEISGGKYPVDHFDMKYEVDQYIRGLPIKSAFVAPGSFMQNFDDLFAPRPIDTKGDFGKFVAPILAEPDKYQGKFFTVSSELRSFEYVTETMSKATGKTVKYVQIPEAKFREFFLPATADVYVNMFLFYQDFGYYGPETKEEVEWAVKNARGRLTTLEEYIQKHVKLE
ncbi:NmrA-like family [Aspergillus sclerotialis]|uniref:NmrA-like family n=1 Tax=Aspergillus sclerotialis TaxID=2070753 RepID=A0A3A2ZQS3_9EURO|nr:NmrA-like family [Aspergillus sclerotialis]